MRPFRSLLPILLVGVSAAASAQTSTTLPEGRFLTTQNDGAVSGVRVQVAPDGSVWFLVPARDLIVRLEGSTMTQWQLRPDNDLGVNPVDFELDGRYVWFIGNGQQGIDAISSYFCRLDTESNEVQEWIVPGTRPAGFWRGPGGKVWIAQSAARIQSVDLATLEVVDFRSLATFAYSTLRPGPDGALWLVDYGNNRLVRWVPGALEETSFTFFTGAFRLSTSHMEFDSSGNIWLAQLDGNTIDRFDPATNRLSIWGGFSRPIHLAIGEMGIIQVTESDGGNGRLALLDPTLAGSSTIDLTPITFTVARAANPTAATVRTRPVTRSTFTTVNTAIPEAEVVVSASFAGILKYQFPSRNAYGIAIAAGGTVWIGSDGKLVQIVPQAIGGPDDLAAPLAVSLAQPETEKIRVDVSLTNHGPAEITGDALYLYSPGAFPARQAFTIPSGGTARFADAFPVGRAFTPVFGPVRIRIATGDPAALLPTVRTVRVRPDGGTFGFSLPALPLSATLPAGETRRLITASRPAEETTIFGLYSPEGATGAARLISPEGDLLGSFGFVLGANERREFNPASSAFGAFEFPDQVVEVSVVSGTVQAYTTVFDLGTRDAAVALPAERATEMVFPSVGRSGGVAGSVFDSDLWLSNPNFSEAAVTLTYVPSDGGGAPRVATLTLPESQTLSIASLLTSRFGLSNGQGALTVSSDVPVSALVRVASQREEGDYAGFERPLLPTDAIDGGTSQVAPAVQDSERRTHLLLYNSGAAGRVTAVILGADGSELGRTQIDLAAGAAGRINAVCFAAGVGELLAGSIRIEAAPGMRVYAQTADLDSVTSDPEFLRPR